jgi:amino acid permease
MKTFSWVLVLIGCVVAGMFWFSIFTADSAPKEAAAAAIAVATAAIPYIFARAIEKLSTTSTLEEILKELKKENKSEEKTETDSKEVIRVGRFVADKPKSSE